MKKLLLLFYLIIVVLFSYIIYSALTDNLELYYKFDNATTNATTTFDSLDTHNGTLDGVTTGISGCSNEQFSFDGNNDRVIILDSANLGETATLTLTAWVNVTTGGDAFISKFGSGVDFSYKMDLSGNDLNCDFKANTEVISVGTTDIGGNDDVWFIVCRYNGTHLSAWVNGVHEDSDALTGTIYNSGVSTYIAYYQRGVDYYGGKIDEMSIYERDLSSVEIVQLYNSGTCLTYPFEVDENAPTNSTWNVTDNVVLGENTTCWDVGCTINITENSLPYTVILNEPGNGTSRIDVEQNYTQMLAANANYKHPTTETPNQSNTLYDNITIGNHCLFSSWIDANKNQPVSGDSSSGCLNFTYFEAPTVNLISPINNLNTTNTSVNFIFNATVFGLSSIINASLYENSSGSWTLNQTITTISNNTNTNFSLKTFSEGSYKWNVFVCGTKGLCDWSVNNYTFTIDLTSPIITITNPENGSLFNKDSVNLNWGVNEVTNWCGYSLNGTSNITITTDIILYNLTETTHNVSISCNDTAGNMGQSSLNFFTVNLQYSLLLDGLEQDRKYEYQTIANLTTKNFSGNVCFDILDDTNRSLNISCGVDSVYNYTIDKLVIITFNDSSNTINLTNTTNKAFIDVENRIDLVLLEFNITGFSLGKYPQNVSFDLNNDSTPDIVIPGTLIANNYFQDDFIFSNIHYKKLNLTFNRKGFKNIFLNITGAGDRTRNGSLKFNITGFDIDSGNDFVYPQNFSTELGGGSLTAAAGINSPIIYDNFNSNDTYGKYDWGTHFSGIFDDDNSFIDETLEQLKCDATASPTGNNFFCSVSPSEIDLRKINQLNFRFTSFIGCRKPDDGTANVKNLLGYFGETNEEFITFFENTIALCRRPDSQSNTITRSYSIYWKDPSFKNVLVSNFSGNIVSTSVASLTGPIRLVFKNEASNDGADGFATSQFFIDYLNVSGLSISHNGTSYNETKINWTSDTLFEAPNNIERAKFASIELLQENFAGLVSADTNLTYWLSNDNGTTWETAVNDTFNVFDSSGSSLKIRIKFETNNTLITPIVPDLNVVILPTGGCSVKIDVGGGQGGNDMDIGFGINSSNSPISYNGSDEFIRGFNCMGLFCSVPIRLEVNQTCQIEISEMNYTKDPNPLNFTNLTNVESYSTIPFIANFSKGVTQIQNLLLNYFGSKNITILAFKENNKSINDSQVIQVRYSQFNLYFPSGQDFWEIFPNKRNETDIEPFGQNTTHGIWQVNSTAYDDPFDLYVRFNESSPSCVNQTTFSGVNLTANESVNQNLNITNLTTTYQKVLFGMNNTIVSDPDIFTFTSIACGSNTVPFYIPYYCFNALCQDCATTTDFDTVCDWSE